jgi:iron complex outermembrane receptor protein
MNRLYPAVISGALLLSFLSHAQESGYIVTEEIVVTATRFEQTATDTPIGVTTISRQQIEESGADTLPEVLSRVAGIAFRDNTGSPDWQVDLRGFGVTGDQNTLVLVDGLRINDNEVSSVRWSSIPLASVERIEILRGGGAVLYGGGATGGVINVITRKPKPRQRTAMAETGGGSYHTMSGGGAALAGTERLGVRANGSHLVSDNYRDNNALRQTNADFGVFTLDPGPRFGLSVGAERQHLGLPGARSRQQLETDRRGATNPNDFSDRNAWFVRAQASAQFGAAELAVDAVDRSKDVSALLDGGFTALDTRAEVRTVAPRAKLAYPALGAQHSLVAGFDWERWDYGSTRTGGADVIAEQETRAVYAQHSSDLPTSTRLTIGARSQRVYYGARDASSPAAYASGSQDVGVAAYELALRQALAGGWALHARVGRSFRIATVDEIYSQFGGPLFDPEVAFLEPQTSRDGEMGVEWFGPGARLRVALFRMDLDNEIQFNPVTFENVNLDPTRRHGAEFDLSWKPSDAVELGLSYALAVAQFKAGSQGGASLEGKTVPLVPRHRAAAWIGTNLSRASRVGAEVRYVGQQFFDNDQTNSFAEKMPAHTVVDLRLAHRIGRLRLSASLENATNARYFTYAIRSLNPLTPTNFNAYPAPERSLFVAAEYRFGD